MIGLRDKGRRVRVSMTLELKVVTKIVGILEDADDLRPHGDMEKCLRIADDLAAMLGA